MFNVAMCGFEDLQLCCELSQPATRRSLRAGTAGGAMRTQAAEVIHELGGTSSEARRIQVLTGRPASRAGILSREGGDDPVAAGA